MQRMDTKWWQNLTWTSVPDELIITIILKTNMGKPGTNFMTFNYSLNFPFQAIKVEIVIILKPFPSLIMA